MVFWPFGWCIRCDFLFVSSQETEDHATSSSAVNHWQMKHLLLTTIAAVVLLGYGQESDGGC